MSDIAAGTDDGKLFHICGPAAWNAQLYMAVAGPSKSLNRDKVLESP